MEKIKAFAYIYFKSLTSPSYYSQLLKTSSSFTWKYLASLALVFGLLAAVPIIYKLSTSVRTDVKKAIASAIKYYPEGFELTVKNNEWSINQPEPFMIPVPLEFKDELDAGAKGSEDPSAKALAEIENIIVFDKMGTIDDLDRYKAFIFVNEKNMIMRATNGTGEIRAVPLKDMPDGTLDKVLAEKSLGELAGVADKFIIAGAILIAILAIPFTFLGLIISAFLLTLVAIIPALIMGAGLGFGQVFRFAKHAITLGLTLQTLQGFLGKEYIPGFIFFFANLILLLIAIVKARGHNLEETGTGTIA